MSPSWHLTTNAITMTPTRHCAPPSGRGNPENERKESHDDILTFVIAYMGTLTLISAATQLRFARKRNPGAKSVVGQACARDIENTSATLAKAESRPEDETECSSFSITRPSP